MRFLTWRQVCNKVGLNSADIFVMQESGYYPMHIEVNGHSIFLEHEVEDWMDLHIQQRDWSAHAKRRRQDADRDTPAADH